MERISLIRKVTEDGYKLLTVASNHALYSDENDEITLAIRGVAVKMSRAELDMAASARAITANGNWDYLATIRDTILDSLAPITAEGDAEIRSSAPRYFSAFAPQATWEYIDPVDAAEVLNEVKKLDSSILGPAHASSPAFVFLRQRYPDLWFDISIDQPSYQLRESCASSVPFTMTVPWRAFLKTGRGPTSTNPLVATGYLVDVIQFDVRKGYPRILSRKFIVERVIDPLHFQPAILPLVAPKSAAKIPGLDVDFKSVLRETTNLRTTLISVSALCASINPMLSILITQPHLSEVVQLVVATIASLAAVTGMIILVLTKVVNALDEGTGGLAKIAGALALKKDSGEEDGARVSEKEIMDGSVFLRTDEAGKLLSDQVGSLKGTWQKISTGGLSRPASDSTTA